MREFLEKHYSQDAVKTRDDTISLAIRALLEVKYSFHGEFKGHA